MLFVSFPSVYTVFILEIMLLSSPFEEYECFNFLNTIVAAEQK